MARIHIIIITIIALLVLSGCGGEKKECPADCGDGNPCTSDSCSKDTNYECRNTPIPGCSLDCGVPCTGMIGQDMEMQCDPSTKECASDIKAGLKISLSSATNEMLSLGNKFKVTTIYNQPFNMKKDLFDIKMSLSQFGTGVFDLKVKKVEISGTDANRQTVTLGEKTLNRYIWDTETKLEEGIRIDFPTSDEYGSFTNVKLRINYEYKQTYGGQTQSKSAVFEITLRGVTFSWVKPGMSYECPASCDDLNSGTADMCNAATGYFCIHQPIPGRCGSYECDPGENKCTCPKDCGPCTGDAGQYLSFTCHDEECKTMLKQGVIQQTIPKLDEKNRNFYYLQNKYTYKNPFNVNTDSFELEFKLYNKQDNVGEVKIVEAKILDRTTEVASVSIGKTLSSIGSTATASMPITIFSGYEDEKSVNIRIDIEYSFTTPTGTELRKDSFTTALGKVTFINPTVS